MHIYGVRVEVDADEKDLFLVVSCAGKDVVMDAVDVFGCYWHQFALTEDFHLSSQLTSMGVVFVDLLQVETVAGTHFFPEVGLEIFHLTGVFKEGIGTLDNTTPLTFREILFHEAGLGSAETFDQRWNNFIKLSRDVVDINRPTFVCFSLQLCACSHSEIWHQKIEIDNCPSGLFEDIGKIGPDRTGC